MITLLKTQKLIETGSPDSSDNEQEGPGDDRDDMDMDVDGELDNDGEGDGENEDENEDNEDEDDEQDQEDSQYSFGYIRGGEQLKAVATTQGAVSHGRTESTQASMVSGIQASSAATSQPNPATLLTSPATSQHPTAPVSSEMHPPKLRQELLTAPVYDIVPTIAAPHSTSINSITATPDLRWVFSGGADGYIRKFNWIETANGKAMLTVAQRHPFVDSVTKAGVLMSYWENEDSHSKDLLESQMTNY